MDRPKGDLKVQTSLEGANWIIDTLPIRFFGDPGLHTACTQYFPEDFGGIEIKQHAELLIDTLKKYRAKAGMGRGLAANQVGISRRMIAVWLDEEPEIFVNPEVVSLEGEGTYWESCISSGTLIIGQVTRPWTGVFKYLDLNAKENALNADEKQTRLLLHEMQHLDGGVCTELYEPGTIRFIRGGKEEVLGYKFERIK